MSKPIDSTLSVKSCASLDVSKDLEKGEGKCINELLDDQKKEDEEEKDDTSE
jgi:hypothetical protein